MKFPKLGEILVHWRVGSQCWCLGGIRFPNLAVDAAGLQLPRTDCQAFRGFG